MKERIEKQYLRRKYVRIIQNLRKPLLSDLKETFKRKLDYGAVCVGVCVCARMCMYTYIFNIMFTIDYIHIICAIDYINIYLKL